ncbi:endonuclease/exonuclease/phosphatase family protein [Flagellimonas meridianipacifica]|uniref:Endonuclease/exonuclease/phosphatase family metal-dependent hydrolase n=1 Tax=Flagellimonas meridianipacifica TaxID=1080225 RepID=A0A2T0M8F0_9FLAO|nr:endonuclease/exonuclease/phosphatase family protein [Allomuricauda pacifica]PRX53816.1 endonuclease/exonuclease/phosphatase family metal-dependent hydrolase [Allomuricauda pacifica]
MKKRNFLLPTLLVGFICCAFGQQLSVLTYNIRFDNPSDGLNRWDSRKGWIASQLNSYHPTVFGTQEGLRHQIDFLDDQLKSYTYVGAGRDDGKEKGEHAAIFFDTTQVKLLGNNTFWLSETPERPSKGWDAAIKRICTYGLFEDSRNGNRFMVFNTHFDHVGETARLESAQLILEKMKQLNPNGLPILLMGDFNLEPDSEGIRLVLKEMKDAHSVSNHKANRIQGTFNGFDAHKPITRRIDYIFFDDSRLKAITSEIICDSMKGRYPSDHFPVHAEFDFK